MGTKSNRSSGTQHNPRGVTQGTTLVDPQTGLPIDTVEDTNGVRRLAVDGNFTAQNVQATVELNYEEDGVHIGDPNTNTTLKIESDGSINANIESDASDGDNVGLKVQDRTITPTDNNYSKRVTAKTGTVDTDTTSLDVSFHDENGNAYTALNPLAKGLESTSNSTTSTLPASGVYTGTFENVKNFSFFTFSIISDQASATDGLEFQWSSNGINIDRIETTNLVAGVGRTFAISIRARYFRVKYTNGSVNQTYFRLATTYHTAGTGIITKPLKGSVNTENFAQLVQAPVMAKLPNDTFANIAGIQLDGQALLGVATSDPIFANIGKSFQATTDNLSLTGTGEFPFLLIDNPIASGKTLRYDKIIFGIPSTGNITWRAYMSPTVTANGIALTPVGARQTSQLTPVVNLYTFPTVSNFGNHFFTVRTDNGSVPYSWELDFAKLIESGYKMLITAQASAGGSTSAVNLEYSEL